MKMFGIALAVFATVFGMVMLSDLSDADTDTTMYKVTLVYNDGTTPDKVIEVAKGGFIPEEELYVASLNFLGWYLDSGCDKPLATLLKITSDTKVYAKWLKMGEEYAITLLDTGMYGVEMHGMVVVEKDKAASEPSAPSKSGYKFAGWYKMETDAETGEDVYVAYDWSKPVTDNISLYASWEKSNGFPTVTIEIVLIVIIAMLLVATYFLRSVKIIALVVFVGVLTGATHFGFIEQLYDMLMDFLNYTH